MPCKSCRPLDSTHWLVAYQVSAEPEVKALATTALWGWVNQLSRSESKSVRVADPYFFLSFISAALHNFSQPGSIKLSIGKPPGSCITPTILGVTSLFNKSIFFAARDSISVHCLGRMQDQVTHASTKVQLVKPRLSWLGHLDHSRTSDGAASNPSNINTFQNGLLQDRRPFVHLRKVGIHARRSSGRLTGRRAAVRSFLGVTVSTTSTIVRQCS